jgi:ABC-type phosphate/phosphonate transport system substrate-binding protein
LIRSAAVRSALAVPLLVGVFGCSGSGGSDGAVRMYFVPSQSRAAMTSAARELTRFVAADSQIDLKAEIPTSYVDVIAALGDGTADVAWLPPIAYLIAHKQAGAEARLQVVRNFGQSLIVVARSKAGEPRGIGDLAGRAVAVPRDLDPELRTALDTLLKPATGWYAVPAGSDREAVAMLLLGSGAPAAAVSSAVATGPSDLVGDGRKELEAERPGTLGVTTVIGQLEKPLERASTSYRGAFIARTDSKIRSLADLEGRSFAYTDEASTSGFVFPRALLRRLGVKPGAEYFVGGHPRVVEEVWAGRVAAGAIYYSPAGAQATGSGQVVGDARGRALERLESAEDRTYFLERLRVFALTDPIPSDVCCVRRGFPSGTWDRLHASVERFLATPDGRKSYLRLVGGSGTAPTDDSSFTELRANLDSAGVDVVELLKIEEAKLGKGKGS